MIPWTNAGGAYKEDPEAFIFPLDETQKFVQYRSSNNAVYHNSGYGPTFGGGHNIYLANGAVIVIQIMHMDFIIHII